VGQAYRTEEGTAKQTERTEIGTLGYATANRTEDSHTEQRRAQQDRQTEYRMQRMIPQTEQSMRQRGKGKQNRVEEIVTGIQNR
jgi:hypothetical protein